MPLPWPRHRALAVLVLVALALPSLAACGGGDDTSDQPAKPSKSATACREKWKKLGDDVASQAAETNPSALPQRWNTVAATIDYYSTSATGKGCADQIDEQQQAITALKAFSAQLTSYDMQAQLALVQDDATTYAGGPWPAAPSPSPGTKKGGKKKPKPVRPPKPALVAAALKSLVSQAPVATQQQGPGWEQASVVDLGDTAAVAKAKKDLAFLSTESSGWRACQVSLGLIRQALAAKTG
jgi:hypothetical protein